VRLITALLVLVLDPLAMLLTLATARDNWTVLGKGVEGRDLGASGFYSGARGHSEYLDSIARTATWAPNERPYRITHSDQPRLRVEHVVDPRAACQRSLRAFNLPATSAP
jgi:hypothetical protein